MQPLEDQSRPAGSCASRAAMNSSMETENNSLSVSASSSGVCRRDRARGDAKPKGSSIRARSDEDNILARHGRQ